jgi:hypothetical protein
MSRWIARVWQRVATSIMAPFIRTRSSSRPYSRPILTGFSRRPLASLSAQQNGGPAMASETLSDAVTLLYTHGVITGRERDAARRRLATVKHSLTVRTCNDCSQVGPSVRFLLEAARYFEKRPTKGEDAAHWSNVSNAANCRRVADLIRSLHASCDTLPKGQDAQQGLAGTESGAVDAEGSETPNPPNLQAGVSNNV